MCPFAFLHLSALRTMQFCLLDFYSFFKFIATTFLNVSMIRDIVIQHIIVYKVGLKQKRLLRGSLQCHHADGHAIFSAGSLI